MNLLSGIIPGVEGKTALPALEREAGVFLAHAVSWLGLLIADPACAEEWTLTAQNTLFYTDDVAIFSATRRLVRDGDPTQPALDNRLTGQGGDGVYEPVLKLSKSFASRFGTTTFDLRGDGFIYFDQTRYNHGTLSMQGRQEFTRKSKLQFRYYYAPNLFLGDNEERQSGTFQIVPERVDSHIGSVRFDQELLPGLELRLLSRYGIRRYNEEFDQRNTDFWTVGPHMEWQMLTGVSLGLSYHYEKGLADGRDQPEFEDDVSYVNHYASADLEVELSERISLVTAFHFEHNQWLSRLAGDERNGADENVYQGEMMLTYRMNEKTLFYSGIQYSTRKESFDAEAVENTNVGIGIQAGF